LTAKIKFLKKMDKIEELGSEICRFAKYYKKGKNMILESNMRKKIMKLNGKKKEFLPIKRH